MLELLNEIDRSVFIAINSFHNSWLDGLMWYASEKTIWIPLYIFLAFIFLKKFGKENFLYLILLCVLMILCSDVIASLVIKPLAARLRPSHTPGIMENIHIINNYRGGLYGFVSSHAANSFALCTFTILSVRKKQISLIMLFYATLVSYSRIYLGVHYPGDIIGGAIIGAAVAAFGFFVLNKFLNYRGLAKI